MNKPTPLKVSAPVRSRPTSSTEEIRKEERNNPPFPPLPEGKAIVLAFEYDRIPFAVRRLRALHGSKRRRDLAAVRMAEELAELERHCEEEAALRAAGVTPDPCRDLRIWVQARRRIRHSLPASTYRIWIKPLRPAGSVGETLFLTAPDDIRAWTERRYFSLIVEALEGSPFTSVSFAAPDLAATGVKA